MADDIQVPPSSLRNAPLGNRENILTAAVDFLKNPVVQRTSPVHQAAFLRHKGLTEEEVKVVFERVAAHVAESNEYSKNLPPPVPLPPVPPPPVPPPIPFRDYYLKPYNDCSRLQRFINTVVLVGVFSYAVSLFYKKFVHSSWFGKEEKIEKSVTELDKVGGLCIASIEELRTSINKIDDTLKALQEQHQQRQFVETFATAKQVEDLKAEITSVKSLLLGRNQFAPPVLQTLLIPPSIPAWQLTTETKDVKDAEEERSQDCKDDSELEVRTCGSGSSENDLGTTNGSDSSLEMIPKSAE